MTSPHPWSAERCAELVAELSPLEGPLLPILHAINETFGCVPPEATAVVAEGLNLSRAEVHGVVTFYHDFRSQPAGRTVLRLCRAEACQSMGGRELGEAVLARLGVDWGGSTTDGAITVEPAYCLGLCAVAPAALVNGEPIGRANPEHLLRALDR